MNGNERSQRLNARELTEEIDRATNLMVGEDANEAMEGAQNATATGALNRERAGVIGSAVLASGSSEKLDSTPQMTERELNTERVEQIVAAEDKLGEDYLATTAPAVPEALIMPQVQGKIDKAAVKILGEMIEKDGNRPGVLDAKVNDLRRRYRVSWEAGR